MNRIESNKGLNADSSLLLYMYYIFKNERKKYRYDDFLPSQSLISQFNSDFKTFNDVFNTNEGYIKYGKPIDWNFERKKTDLFKKNILIGAKFERYVEAEFKKYGIDIGMFTDSNGQYHGENKFGIEIKYCSADNLIFVKYKSCLKYNGNKTNNGVIKDDNTKYWLEGKPSQYYIFLKKDLLEIYNRLNNGEQIEGCKFNVADRDYNNSKCFTMTIAKCKELMITDSIEEFVRMIKEGEIK